MADKAEELVKEAIKKAAEEELKTRKAQNEEEQAGEAEAGKKDVDAANEQGSLEETGEEDELNGLEDEVESEGCAEAGDDEAAAGEDAGDGKKKIASIFKKKEKKDKRDEKIAELSNSIVELNDKVKRNMAEFDNFRKRTEREKSQMFEVGAKSIVEKLLPTIDNFERGLASLSEEEKSGAFAQGIEKIYKQLLSSLEEAGVKPIEALGKEFDPNLHNAVMHEENEELGENVVSQELQKGYMYRDTVVRHSMVKVAN